MMAGPIMVGLDFRQPSLAAARWAAEQLAGESPVLVLHVNPVVETPSFLPAGWRLHDDGDRTLQSRVEGLRGFVDTLPADRVRGEVRVGEEVVELVGRARASGASMVVLGGAKASRASGRTLHRLIRSLDVPVVVVGPEGGTRPRRILAALDDAAIAGQVIRRADELAQKFDARLTLFHALPDCEAGNVAIRRTRSWMRQMYERVTGRPFTGCTTVSAGQAGPVLLDHARAMGADLVVAGRNGKHAAGPTELGATTKLLLRAARLPLVIVPPARAAARAGTERRVNLSQGVNACQQAPAFSPR
jgi:nucleotide-binding universal stress UspA family protein